MDDVQRLFGLRLERHVVLVVEMALCLGEVRRSHSLLRLRHLDFVDLPRSLAKGDLKALLGPERVLLEAQRCRDRLLTRIRQWQIFKSYRARLTRQDVRRIRGRFPDDLAVEHELQMQLIDSDIREQALVVDGDLLCRDIEVEVLVIELDFLHLRRQLAVCKQDAVTAEVAIVRAVAEVAAVRQRIFAVAVLVPDGLVDEIPDEAALIERFLVREVRVLVHAADAVAHRMRVLAADERLVAVLREELLDGGDRRVHLALHVARTVVTAIPEDVLVMDEARRVCLTEVLAHHVKVLAAAGLVAAGPDQDGRMILVALEHGFRAVEDDILPLLMVIRQRILDDVLLAVAHPAAVRLKVRLVDDVEAVAVAEFVDIARVRIMRAAQCIDIVLLHHDDILLNLRRICRTAAVAVELVAVRALEDDALAVELHDRAVHAEFTEADVLRDDFEQMALCILDGDDGTIEVRLLRTPELDALELCLKGRAQALDLLLLREQAIARLRIVELDCYLVGLAAVPLHVEMELAVLILVDGLCRDAQVIEVNGRLRVEHDLAEDAREAPEILVLDPASRAEAEDLQG